MLERVFYLVFNEKFINFVAICTKLAPGHAPSAYYIHTGTF